MLYRIYTEDINEQGLEKLMSETKGTGFWRLQKGHSLIIEIVLPDIQDEKVVKLANAVKKLNNQEAVLVQKIKNEQWIV